MAVITAEKLYQNAAQGKRLRANERRHVLAYLDVTDPGRTHVELGKFFQVTEEVIRKDRQKVRKKLAIDLKDELDISSVMVDLENTFRHELRDMQVSKLQTPLGSEKRLRHSVAIVDTYLKVLKSYQEFGILPKNAAAVYKQSYNFITVLGENQVLEAKEVDLLDKEMRKILTIPAEIQGNEIVPIPVEEQVDEPISSFVAKFEAEGVNAPE